MKEFLKRKEIFFLLGICFLLIPNVEAATIRVSSCSQSQVQSAIDGSSAGDTIIIPNGNCSWSSGVTITKGVIVQGESQTSTVITGSGNYIFHITGNGTGNFRITNMKFMGGTGYDISIGGGWNTLRIDNIIWNTSSSNGIRFRDYAWGCTYEGLCYSHQKALIDNISYTQGGVNAGRPFLFINGRGHKAWQEEDGWGSDNFIFLEDSKFTYTSELGYLTDTEHGARLVVRHVTSTNGGITQHDLGSTPRARGNRALEAYNNTIICNLGASLCDGKLGLQATRGGTAIIYNNTISGFDLYTWPMIFRVAYNYSFIGGGYCSETGTRKMCQSATKHCIGGSRVGRSCYDDSMCPGSSCNADYSCSSNSDCKDFDGNAGICMQIDGSGGSPAGWPCRDQPGRGKDDAITGIQASSPIYWWNNTVNGDSNIGLMVGSQYSSYIKENRDYCNHSPATACGSKGPWTYNAFTYPHPFRSESPLLPPSNVRIAQ